MSHAEPRTAAPPRNLPTAKGMVHFERTSVSGHQVDVFFGDDTRLDRRGRSYLRLLAVDPDKWTYCYAVAYVDGGRTSFKGVDVRDGARFDGEVALDASSRPVRGTLRLASSAPRREKAAKEVAERAFRGALRRMDPAAAAAAVREREAEAERAAAEERRRLHEAQLAAMVAGLKARRATDDADARVRAAHARQATEARERAEALEREEMVRAAAARKARAAAAAPPTPTASAAPRDPVLREADGIMGARFRTKGDVRGARVRIVKLLHVDHVGTDRYTRDLMSYNDRLDVIGRHLPR